MTKSPIQSIVEPQLGQLSQLIRSKYRAPRSDGQSLVEPPLSQLKGLLLQNQKSLATTDFQIGDTSFSELRSNARKEVFGRAREFTRSILEAFGDEGTILSDFISNSAKSISEDVPVFATGHQPALFHPGVWFKNFLVSEQSKSQNAIGLNFVIDNDLCRQSSLSFPAMKESQLEIVSAAYDDHPAQSLPYETTPVLNASKFEQFGKTVQGKLTSQIESPLISRIWPIARKLVASGQSLSLALSGARIVLEHQEGMRNLEIPLSQMCDTDSFHQFAFCLIESHRTFHDIYNSSLKDYRTANKIRSHARPVPNLTSESGWLEVPFWIWSKLDLQRRPLFAKTEQGNLWIGCQTDSLNSKGQREFQSYQVTGPEAFSKLLQSEISIRPRALMTTLFIRFFVADVFVHGIGGAKYDELTDLIAAKFFGVSPPRFVTATSTHQLPIDFPANPTSDIEAAKTRARNLKYHPEVFLGDKTLSDHVQDEIRASAEKKQIAIKDRPESGSRKLWHREIIGLRAQMVALAQPLVKKNELEISRLKKQLQQHRTFGSREFSYVCHPETLIEKLRQLAGGTN